ncbi:hypothetical protein C1T23_00005 [Lactiplantibacillus plantarum]|nr:hypothetical protein C1T23_00005 [Lactiplantibacillus plantarum]
MTCGHISVTRYPLLASDYASTYSATAHKSATPFGMTLAH